MCARVNVCAPSMRLERLSSVRSRMSSTQYIFLSYPGADINNMRCAFSVSVSWQLQVHWQLSYKL